MVRDPRPSVPNTPSGRTGAAVSVRSVCETEARSGDHPFIGAYRNLVWLISQRTDKSTS